MKLNHPLFAHLRDATHKIQQTLSGWRGGAHPQPAAPQPAMRDINPPPGHAPAPEAAQPTMPEAAAPAAAINPATHPTEYAQDILNRMGIQVDLQAGMQNLPPMPQFDLSNMELPGFKTPFDKAPAAEVPAGAEFIR